MIDDKLTISTVKEKILSDREYIFSGNYIDRDFSFKELPGMAVIVVGARRSGKTSWLRHHATRLVNDLQDKPEGLDVSVLSTGSVSGLPVAPHPLTG